MRFFDVCNDYSLDEMPNQPSDLGNYSSHKSALAGMLITVFTHRLDDEIHYVSTDHHDGHMLQGLYLD